jgi:hypothetical protein
MFQEFEDMIIKIVDTAHDSLITRINLPDVAPILHTIIPMIFATQLYESLQITNKDGQVYKLKALKYSKFNVPEFITPFIQTIGSFETTDGIIETKNSETLLLRLLTRAFNNFDANVVNLPGYVPLVQMYGDPVWPTFDFAELKNSIAESFFTALYGQTFIIQNAVGNPLTVRLPFFNRGDDPVTYAQVNSQIVLDPNLIYSMWAFGALWNMDTFDQFLSINDPFFWNAVGIFPSNQTVTQFTEWTGFVAQYYTCEFSGLMEKLFKCSVFAPAKQGTYAQFVQPERDETYLGSSYAGKHKYDIPNTDVAAGFVLIPSTEVDLTPHYTVDSDHSRVWHLNELARRYRVAGS